MILYFLSLVLLVMGLYCLIAKKNIVKKIIGIVIAEYSINLFLVLVGYRHGGIAPILMKGMQNEELVQKGVDPLPQALVLTSIVIGLGTTAMVISLCLRLFEKYGTFDILQIRRLKG